MKEFDLDTPLLELKGKDSTTTHWSARHAVEGVQIFGGIGSGKTSGSGRKLALKYLAAGFGGLVLTAKPDEKTLWEDYCAKTGRTQDLIIVEPGGKHFFNFMDYESSSVDGGRAITENIVDVLKTVIKASEEKSGRSDDSFFETALDMLIFHVVDLCMLAYGKVSIQMIYDIVQSLPTESNHEARDTKEGEAVKPSAFQAAYKVAHDNVTQQIINWNVTQGAAALKKLNESGLYDEAVSNSVADAMLLKFVNQFFFETYKKLSEKTRSIIDFSFSGFLFRLLREPVFSLFCKNTSTFSPDDCLQGKIIILNLPVKLYHKAGRDCQIMFKYFWQRAMEKRNIEENGRPVILWADEAQNFLHERDADCQATARSSRIATVYLSQNLPNYHANMGGEKSDYRVKSFLGTLGTKIFHANGDIETNKYASELIGQVFFEDVSNTVTEAGNYSSSKTKSLKLESLVRPEAFARLKTGGRLNDFKVQAYLHLQGNSLKDGFSHTIVQFDQQ